ncbi:hypothetical protein QBC40DRAFT_279865 [Triangularia verruculosa]|uniref:Ph domain-containing protein n=1 Tax=Triangularia verruculosa TaxID=2587418 RepID=A0AAN6XH85_9PEZI|nr:hypothetical protein QBC40DRAFT_279865 [Triangularia verruculosa]
MNVAIKILEKKALKKLGKDKTNTNSENPYLEKVPVYKNGKIAKYKTQERPIPQGLSKNDAKILRKVRRRAYRWDMGFSCCCIPIRFGWAAIIGLLPVIGDFADFLMALALIKKASKVDGGLPKRLYGMMFTNIMLDFAIGFVPLIGDIADVFYRANTKNAWLLDAYLAEKAKALQAGVVQDPETGSIVEIPDELAGAEGDRDVETGVTRVGTMPSLATPAAVTPARSARQAGGPTGNTAAAPQSAPVAPVRNLTPPRAPTGGGLPGRQITPKQDPRDNRGKGGRR